MHSVLYTICKIVLFALFVLIVLILPYFFYLGTGETQRPPSPVHQILEAIPAELYVPNQQQWISLKSGSRLASLPFCCR